MKKDFYWYKIYSIKGIGPKRLYRIYELLKKENISIEQLFEKKEFLNDIKFIDLINLKNSSEVTEDLYNLLKKKNIEIISFENENYPKKLRTRLKDEAPPILFVLGKTSILNSKSLAIIGSRNASQKALSIAREFAFSLASNGYTIISGYAKGIDTEAHIGSLEGGGSTIMVLSYGILEFKLKQSLKNKLWEKRITAISQFHPKEKWKAANAMKRNSVVCGISEGVIVIESGPERDEKGRSSGTFQGGLTALSLNIPLFVLSPKILGYSARGNIELIKKGGIEIQTWEDIVNFFKERKLKKKIEKLVQPKLF